MDMAVCALKQTKAVTMAHWSACEDHDRAEAGDIAWRKAVMKNTRAVTLPHWAACTSWRGTHQEQITQRAAWLLRCGVVVDNKGA